MHACRRVCLTYAVRIFNEQTYVWAHIYVHVRVPTPSNTSACMRMHI